MERLNTPEPDSHESRLHVPTPIKSKIIKGAVEFCDKIGISYSKEDVFRTFNVSHATGWRALSNQPRRHHNEPTTYETRGRHSKVTPQKIREMERILEEDEFEARALTWEQLGYEVGLECSERTIQRAMSTMDYHKCVVCRKGWVNEKTARRRVEWATVMLERYPEKTN
jgi:transposase